MKIDKNDIDIYLSEIAERLWLGQASLMVGAGFSMNAIPKTTTTKKIPSWKELGDCFFQKIYEEKTTEKRDAYLDISKLAEEVEAYFGRKTLEEIIEKNISDKEFIPSELHDELVKLPWSDIFTTNYDTLLERSADKIFQKERHYQIILNKEDLTLSTKPRIIKLHGSFPSHRPFIITQEDYRKFPFENAPFVNTVRQSLMENYLCLIGFSGNDPNFLHWIGWVKDNLEKFAPQIYFIGCNISNTERKWLESKEITPVDISCLAKINENKEDTKTELCDANQSDKELYPKALFEFIKNINELLKQKNNSTTDAKPNTNLDWPRETTTFFRNKNKDIISQLEEVTKLWKDTRESYPNWLILPKNSRDVLLQHTDNLFLYDIEKVNTSFDIEFLYEYNWRQEKCLIPIFNSFVAIYEGVINKYNPFPKKLQKENTITPDGDNTINWDLISIYWIELQLSLLRFYREEGFDEKWNSLANELTLIQNEFSSELLARYCYERCLYYLFSLDIASVRNELKKWPTVTLPPYWEAKRAGIMAELGDTEEAEKILEASLKEIKNGIQSSQLISDYALISQEAYILQLLKYVKQSLNIKQGKNNVEEFKNYSERWSELIQYKCDPWGELKLFDVSLHTDLPYKFVRKNYSFEIGSITNTYHLSKDNTYAIGAYSFLRYLEEVSIPLKLPNSTFAKETAQKAIPYVSKFSLNWGLVSLIRSGNAKIVDAVLGRQTLSSQSQEICDELVIVFLDALTKSTSEIEKGNAWNNNTFAISLATVIPEIFSRLCVKCSYDVKFKVLIFLKELYCADYEKQCKYSGIKSLIKNIINSFSHEEQYYLLPLLLDFPIIDTDDPRNEYLEPFQFFTTSINSSRKSIDVKSKINELFSLASISNSKRKFALWRLYSLFKYKILNQQQINKFGNILWKQTAIYGFPIETDFYYFAFLVLPHPKNVNPIQLLKNYINKSELPVQANKTDDGISITKGNDSIFHNILGTNAENCDYFWSKDDIDLLLSRMITWWNDDKEYLKETEIGFGGSISDEFKYRFKKMIRIFSNIMTPNIELISPNYKTQIEMLLDELAGYGMPDLEAKAAFSKIYTKKDQSLYNEINKKLFSKSESDILDAVNAVSVLIINKISDVTFLVEAISENIKYRTEVELDIFIDTIWVVINNNSQIITDKILKNILLGMEYLIKEIDILEDDPDEIIHNKLLIKRSVSRLLPSLKKFYLEEKKCDIPQYIMDWEKKCLDVNEFSEIRNTWINSQV